MKPTDFFIGVIDFFSVLLPGALLTYFFKGLFYENVFGAEKLFPAPELELVGWTVFLLITYIVGNLVFMLGSFLDLTYDRILRRLIFQKKYDLSFKTARVIHHKHVDVDLYLKELFVQHQLTGFEYQKLFDNPRREIFNTFKWAQHFLLLKSPKALADIQRIEADSKFFRSLVAAFLIIATVLFAEFKALTAFLFLIFSALCYYRYGELRFKATEKAYEMIITHCRLEPAATTTTNAAWLEKDYATFLD